MHYVFSLQVMDQGPQVGQFVSKILSFSDQSAGDDHKVECFISRSCCLLAGWTDSVHDGVNERVGLRS